MKNAAAYRPGPVTPSLADKAPVVNLLKIPHNTNTKKNAAKLLLSFVMLSCLELFVYFGKICGCGGGPVVELHCCVELQLAHFLGLELNPAQALSFEPGSSSILEC